MPIEKLCRYLDDAKVKYTILHHSLAYTAREVAESIHIPRQEMAKPVIVKLNDVMAMAVLAANEELDLELLRRASGAAKVELAQEREFRDAFPGCELGAMPPFGRLCGIQTFVSTSLAGQSNIVFNAGTHTDVISLTYKDFEMLEQPHIAEIGRPILELSASAP